MSWKNTPQDNPWEEFRKTSNLVQTIVWGTTKKEIVKSLMDLLITNGNILPLEMMWPYSKELWLKLWTISIELIYRERGMGVTEAMNWYNIYINWLQVVDLDQIQEISLKILREYTPIKEIVLATGILANSTPWASDSVRNKIRKALDDGSWN